MKQRIGKLTRHAGGAIVAIFVSFGIAQAEDLAIGGLSDAGDGRLYKTDGLSLSRSDDGGENWRDVSFPALGESEAITAVAASTENADQVHVAGKGFGVYRSTDAGETWVNVTGELPDNDALALTAHATEANTLYIVMADEGIYRSQDAGESWRLMHAGLSSATISALTHTDMEGSMETGWLLAATDKGVYRTMDCFCLFELASGLPGGATAVTHNPVTPAEIYTAVGGEIFRSARGGEAWEHVGKVNGEVSALSHSGDTLYALLIDGNLLQSTNGSDWR
ncbi:YCF48-related protein [Aquisalimonas lutea]|uniref:WD40/YVTN/BNR-like repeat-containing protein n=1 Tax=Aquisalimonas lutea TaxID=1327750 RepID=UPI0025B4440B|nr:YCF48-related protein [Aquisalimonas lutea]MDN3519067.1 YCF48-related protein [Aquisalimonas lutea]